MQTPQLIAKQLVTDENTRVFIRCCLVICLSCPGVPNTSTKCPNATNPTSKEAGATTVCCYFSKYVVNMQSKYAARLHLRTLVGRHPHRVKLHFLALSLSALQAGAYWVICKRSVRCPTMETYAVTWVKWELAWTTSESCVFHRPFMELAADMSFHVVVGEGMDCSLKSTKLRYLVPIRAADHFFSRLPWLAI